MVDRWIPESPALKVHLPRAEPPRRRRYLDRDQIAALSARAQDLAPPGSNADLIVLMLAHVRLRFGELAGLQVRDFDPEVNTLDVRRSLTEVNGVLTESPPKNGKPRLSTSTASSPNHSVNCGQLVTGSILHFFKQHGGRRCGIATSGAAGSTEQSMTSESQSRHTTYATQPLFSGFFLGVLTVLQVQRMLGHALPSITLDTYSDLFAADAEDTAHALDACTPSG